MRGATLDEGRLWRLEGASNREAIVDSTLDWRPNIIEFALDERYLGVQLYPRQATLLKLLFCSLALFTDYDHDVLAEWRPASAAATATTARRRMWAATALSATCWIASAGATRAADDGSAR